MFYFNVSCLCFTFSAIFTKSAWIFILVLMLLLTFDHFASWIFVEYSCSSMDDCAGDCGDCCCDCDAFCTPEICCCALTEVWVFKIRKRKIYRKSFVLITHRRCCFEAMGDCCNGCCVGCSTDCCQIFVGIFMFTALIGVLVFFIFFYWMLVRNEMLSKARQKSQQSYSTNLGSSGMQLRSSSKLYIICHTETTPSIWFYYVFTITTSF